MTWIHAHSETLLGVLLGLLVTIPIGLYLSLYAGLIVARRARFEDLRYELIRILQCLEWPPDTRGFRIVGGHRPYDITLIAGDLIALGHPIAAGIVGQIDQEVSRELCRQTDFPSAEEMEARFTCWMRLARTMRPDAWPIIVPSLRLFRKAHYEMSESQGG